jgi:chitinase
LALLSVGWNNAQAVANRSHEGGFSFSPCYSLWSGLTIQLSSQADLKMARKTIPPLLSEYFRKIGRKGGNRCLVTMTPEERSDRARKAAAKSTQVRQEKARKVKGK